MDGFLHFFWAYKQFGRVTGKNFVKNHLRLEMQRCNMYKLYMFYIQNCTPNPNQSPLLQIGSDGFKPPLRKRTRGGNAREDEGEEDEGQDDES